MATKGTGHKRVKTFKMDEAHIPFDYQCKMYMLKKDGTEYEEVMVPFMYLVLDTYFTHKKLLKEYFPKCCDKDTCHQTIIPVIIPLNN